MAQSEELTEAEYLSLKRWNLRKDMGRAVDKAAYAYQSSLTRTLDKRLEKPGKGVGSGDNRENGR